MPWSSKASAPPPRSRRARRSAPIRSRARQAGPGRSGCRMSSPRCPAGRPRTTACCTAAASTTASSTSSTACRSTSGSIGRPASRPTRRRSTPSPSSAATCRRSSATRPAASSRCGPAPRRVRGAASPRSPAAATPPPRPKARPAARWAVARRVWLHGGGERSSRYLDPVHPDNLHNRGGGVTTAGQITAGSGARDRVTASWSGGGARFDVPNTEEQEDAGQAQRQRLAQGALTVSWQRGWSGSTVSQLAGYVRRNRSRLDPSDFDTPLTARRRSPPHADRRAGRRHASGRPARGQGRRRDPAAPPRRGASASP